MNCRIHNKRAQIFPIQFCFGFDWSSRSGSWTRPGRNRPPWDDTCLVSMLLFYPNFFVNVRKNACVWVRNRNSEEKKVCVSQTQKIEWVNRQAGDGRQRRERSSLACGAREFVWTTKRDRNIESEWVSWPHLSLSLTLTSFPLSL
jgi:hypothetical protein